MTEHYLKTTGGPSPAGPGQGALVASRVVEPRVTPGAPPAGITIRVAVLAVQVRSFSLGSETGQDPDRLPLAGWSERSRDRQDRG